MDYAALCAQMEALSQEEGSKAKSAADAISEDKIKQLGE